MTENGGFREDVDDVDAVVIQVLAVVFALAIGVVLPLAAWWYR